MLCGITGPSGIGGQSCVHYDTSVAVPTACASDNTADDCIDACVDADSEPITGMALKNCAGENVVGVGILMPTLAGTAFRPPAAAVAEEAESSSVVIIAVIICVVAVAAVVGGMVWRRGESSGKTTVQPFEGAAPGPEGP